MRRLGPILAMMMAFALACGDFSREAGVCLPNQMDAIALGYIAERNLLDDDEELLAYYDDTISLDGTSLSLVTTKHLISHFEGNTTKLELAKIESIDPVEVPMADAWLITERSGKSVQIQVAVMNGGDVFEKVMTRAWKHAKDGE